MVEYVVEGGVVVWQQGDNVFWQVGFEYQFDGVCGDQVGLFGWFGQYGVVGYQCGIDLVEENCQWEVLWVDVGEDVVVFVEQFVVFVGWVVQFFVDQVLVGLLGVVVVEVDCFVDFVDIVL